MRILNKLKKLISDKQGNIAITFGLTIMPIMLSIGAAIDYTRASDLRARVSHATDAAVLAAVSNVMQTVDLEDTAAVNQKLQAEFGPFFLANMEGETGYTYNGYTISYDPLTKKVDVDVDIEYKTAIFGIVGMDKWDASVEAATTMELKAGGAISMYLVLDRSGSMGWRDRQGVIKMSSLKQAVTQMNLNFQNSDPDKEFVRMGAVAYSSYTWSSQPITWDINNVTNYVNRMYASGGTNSSGAVDRAYRELTKAVEENEHQAKSGQSPSKIMVFMTDGDNNRSWYDTSTKTTCRNAKRDGIEIYTVAFAAPRNGQNLLKYCASSTGHHFEPENTNELIASFKNIGKKVAEKLVLAR